MTLTIETFILGAIDNNIYLVSDPKTKEAVLIDPAIPSGKVLDHIREMDLHLTQIWITHAHFDHIGGVRWFVDKSENPIQVFMHQQALPLWENAGGARDFGFDFEPGPAPDHMIQENETLSVGAFTFNVLHTPGHTPGHVTYYCEQAKAAFCGDLIFYHGVGRTDLAGSDPDALTKSITEKIFTLPGGTKLYPGHGKATTVAEEIQNNPFI